MTPSLSKLQLNTVLSALDGQPRNPNSRDAALKRIARHGEQLGLSLDDLLMAAAGLLDGRMDAAAFVAALKEANPGAPQKMDTEEVTPETSDAGAAQQLYGPAPLVDGASCPLCGRLVRRSRNRDAREPALRRHRDGSKERR